MAKKKSDHKWVKVHIPADLAERLEGDDLDLDDVVAGILRAHLDDAPGATPGGGTQGGTFASFIADAMAPLKDHPLAPQLEKVAKDVASKVAKDVATAAATAAFAAWSAKMSQKPDPGASPPPPARAAPREFRDGPATPDEDTSQH
jgi:hypothetical protein